MRSITVMTVAAIFTVAGLVSVANAQQSTPQPGYQGRGNMMMGPWMMGPGGMMNGGSMGPWMMGPYGAMPMMNGTKPGTSLCGMMAGHIEGRLAYLKAELKITDAQQPLWDAYAKTLRDNAQGMTEGCTAMMGSGSPAAINLPDRLDRHVAFMEAHLAALRAMSKTLKPLYATFSDAQKQAADDLIWGPMGMM